MHTLISHGVFKAFATSSFLLKRSYKYRDVPHLSSLQNYYSTTLHCIPALVAEAPPSYESESLVSLQNMLQTPISKKIKQTMQ